MIIILLGPPGVGKGTQAKIIAAKLNIIHISTGDMLRDAVASGTELGKKAKIIMDAGNLVPDDIMVGIIREVLQSDKCKKGLILDGFPRTIPQAEALTVLLSELKLKLDAVINLDINQEENIRRLSNRMTCRQCGKIYNLTQDKVGEGMQCPNCSGELYYRDDDRPEVVKQRLEVYEKNTAPLKDYYQKIGLLRTIDASGTIETITKQILSSLGQN